MVEWTEEFVKHNCGKSKCNLLWPVLDPGDAIEMCFHKHGKGIRIVQYFPASGNSSHISFQAKTDSKKHVHTSISEVFNVTSHI